MTIYKEARIKKGLTQLDVCLRVGLSLTAYSNIEKGITKQPKPETIEALYEVLGVK